MLFKLLFYYPSAIKCFLIFNKVNYLARSVFKRENFSSSVYNSATTLYMLSLLSLLHIPHYETRNDWTGWNQKPLTYVMSCVHFKAQIGLILTVPQETVTEDYWHSHEILLRTLAIPKFTNSTIPFFALMP